VILLDTHIWVWWVSRPDRLQSRRRDLLELGVDRIFGVSIGRNLSIAIRPPNCLSQRPASFSVLS
jgi:PIN domain nuclease of toxin-antitoxin system